MSRRHEQKGASVAQIAICYWYGGCSAPACGHDYQQHDHAQTFDTWSWETDRPLILEALREAASRLPVHVYRAKGVIFTPDAPKRRAVLQVVGKRLGISLQDE